MSGVARRITAVAVVLTLLVASPAHALIADPVEAGLLAKISAALQAIDEFRMRVMDKLEKQINTRVNVYAFPNRLFGAIRATATAVTDIRGDLQHMACAWPMSLRTRPLSDLFWERTQLCRSGYQAVLHG